MLIDSHAHLNFKAFDQKREKVVNNCLSENIWMVNVGTNQKTSEKAVELTRKYIKGVYAAVGIHPIVLSITKPAKNLTTQPTKN